MKRRRLWFKTGDIKVYIQDGLQLGGVECYALYDEKTGDVYVAPNSPEVMMRKLLHELGHKMLHGIPGPALVALLGKDGEVFDSQDEVDARAEDFCEFLETRGFDILKPWLKFPKVPK